MPAISGLRTCKEELCVTITSKSWKQVGKAVMEKGKERLATNGIASIDCARL
jgi:hypothetical protein